MFGYRQSSAPVPRGMTRQFRMVSAIYVIVALVYSGSSAVTESGLAGYVLKLEMDIIGIAEVFTTLPLTMFLLLLPFGAMMWIVEKLAPSRLWIYADAEADFHDPSFTERMNRPLTNVSWKAVFMVTAIPVVVGAILYPSLYYSTQREQAEKVYPINLASGVADTPKNAKFVDLTGMVAHSYAVVFKTISTKREIDDVYELFAPITGAGWTPAEPVRYFVRYEPSERSGGKVVWPEAFRQRGAVTFSGKISRSLPSYVESKFRSKGLQVDPSYSVIEYRKGKASYDRAPLAGGICLMFAAFAFVVMLMVKFRVALTRKRLQGLSDSQRWEK